MANSDYAIEMKDIVKRFGDFTALGGVSLNVEKGAIHALLGENGAGKTTLMNVLYGVYAADEGEVRINGAPVRIQTPKDAIALGIGMVHQHFMLVENMTVTQNIILGREVTKYFGVLDMKRATAEIRDLCDRYGLLVDPGAKISDLSVSARQRVEVLKILFRSAEILILDEPTAVLTPAEVVELAQILRTLSANGKTIIVITHKLKEIRAFSDKCTIIRRGKVIDTVDVREADEQRLAALMVGRGVRLSADKTPASPKEPALVINDLRVRDKAGALRLNGFNLTVRAGEIAGLAGVDGNGQTELVDALTGMARIDGGTVESRGAIAAIHEDRQARGLILDFSCEFNTILGGSHRPPFSRMFILRFRAISEFCKGIIKRFDVRPMGCEKMPARALSGGNQQKLILGRAFSGDPAIIIAAQPTRGLDVGAIEFVHEAVIAARDRGAAVLLISSELDEVLDAADTVCVIYGGKIIKTFDTNETPDEQTVGFYMAGGQ